MEVFEKLVRHLPETVGEFRAKHPYSFLVRRPITVFQREAPLQEEDIEYRTVAIDEGADGIPPWQWWIAPLVKRPENPFPDHLSVGRAPNCDVVMRFRYVSKLHARFLLKDALPVSLEDSGSSNGTGVNGRRLEAGAPSPIVSGDKLSFGSLVVELMDSASLHSLLRRRALTSQPPRSGTA